MENLSWEFSGIDNTKSKPLLVSSQQPECFTWEIFSFSHSKQTNTPDSNSVSFHQKNNSVRNASFNFQSTL